MPMGTPSSRSGTPRRPDGRVPARLPDPLRLRRGVGRAESAVLKDHPGEEVGAQRDDAVLGVERQRRVEAVDPDDLQLALGLVVGAVADEPDEPELRTGERRAPAQREVQDVVDVALHRHLEHEVGQHV
jgi:hypothetical protein